ncbi:hypothetical protein Tco_0700574 [Tanacetum coccineum]
MDRSFPIITSKKIIRYVPKPERCLIEDKMIKKYNKGHGGLGDGQRMVNEIEAKTSSLQSRKRLRSEGSIEVRSFVGG